MEDLLSKNLHYRSHHYSEEKFGALDSKSIQSITKLSLGRLTLWWDQWDTHYGYTPRRQLCDEISRRNQKYLSLFISGPDGFESWKKIKVEISWHTFFREEIVCELIARAKRILRGTVLNSWVLPNQMLPFSIPPSPSLQGALWVGLFMAAYNFSWTVYVDFGSVVDLDQHGSGTFAGTGTFAWIRN